MFIYNYYFFKSSNIYRKTNNKHKIIVNSEKFNLIQAEKKLFIHSYYY